jgi:carbamoyl-phosphate synthase large subunit
MPKHEGIKTVLVIGSGPIVIGQAAEFDYAGTQACLALKEEGCKVILINNNPATIMTDEEFADVVYFEPLTVESVEKILVKEKPDGLLATLGGQTGLNLALELHKQGILEKYNIPLLGTPIESIMKGEDRELFRALMHELHEPVPESEIVSTLEESLQFAEHVGYPIIVRPAYTLGGSGGGIAQSKEELEVIAKRGLKASPIHQCLIEKSIAGFKEVEYEVMRDENDTCITICNMENVDPVGVHTGDSIVVAPSQTLTDVEYQMLRSASLKIIRALGIVGGCNIQFALDPYSKQYYLIEVNPRVSRSSALASKATGYPIAKIAAKLSLGYNLHELFNPVTGHTYASFEPALDYAVVKFPCWPFDKFNQADRTLGTQMKATGEVMAIERNLESGFQKAVRSLELNTDGLALVELNSYETEHLWDLAKNVDDRRFFVLLELLRRGASVEEIHNVTKINKFFLDCFKRLISLEEKAKQTSLEQVSSEELLEFKQKGFSDEWLARVWNVDLQDVREKRKQYEIFPSYKMVDTCAAEFTASTAYYYSSWKGEHDAVPTDKKKILIVGSGPIRIGQGIEFDYCSVHGVMALEKNGYETILINNNPETVSTDYAVADRLYFEPLAVEDVLNVVEFEQVDGVIVQYGGQTAISLVEGLENAGVPLLGTTKEVIDQLEDRDLFYQFLQKLNVPHIPGQTAFNKEDLIQKVAEIGYPVLIRPSYVIGGKGMIILSNEAELKTYADMLDDAVHFPILTDAYYPGKEVEVDVVTDGEDILIPGIFEHVEKAGVHSGDSMAVTPPYSILEGAKEKVVEYAERIAKGMDFKGIFNIQFVLYNNELYVLEVNPRASRTVPILSKVTGTNMIQLATDALLGKKLADINPTTGLLPETNYFTIKAPIFSNFKLPGVDPKLGPEMKSTGEIISIANSIEEGFHKVFMWNEQQSNVFKEEECQVYLDIELSDLESLNDYAAAFKERGITLAAGADIAKKADWLEAVEDYKEWLKTEKTLGMISLKSRSDQGAIENRQLAVQHGLIVMTDWETVEAFLAGKNTDKQPQSIQAWKKSDYKEVISQ